MSCMKNDKVCKGSVLGRGVLVAAPAALGCVDTGVETGVAPTGSSVGAMGERASSSRTLAEKTEAMNRVKRNMIVLAFDEGNVRIAM